MPAEIVVSGKQPFSFQKLQCRGSCYMVESLSTQVKLLSDKCKNCFMSNICTKEFMCVLLEERCLKNHVFKDFHCCIRVLRHTKLEFFVLAESAAMIFYELNTEVLNFVIFRLWGKHMLAIFLGYFILVYYFLVIYCRRKAKLFFLTNLLYTEFLN